MSFLEQNGQYASKAIELDYAVKLSNKYSAIALSNKCHHD